MYNFLVSGILGTMKASTLRKGANYIYIPPRAIYGALPAQSSGFGGTVVLQQGLIQLP